MILNYKFIYALFYIGFLVTGISQNAQSPSSELFRQAEKLISQKDYEKAKLTLKLYQKYEENNLQKWLNAQNLIIRSELELNNINIAKTLINSAKEKLDSVNKPDFELVKEIQFYEAEIFEIENNFKAAEKIYRNLLKKKNSGEVEIKLANNLIDRILSSYSDKIQRDYEELRLLVSKYEKDEDRNPLELIRIKHKLSSYQMVNQETLTNLEKIETYWLKKDEYTVFRIYLNNVVRNYEKAYKVWFENKDLISLKSHPLTVKVLGRLARHFQDTELLRSKEIMKVLPVLVRDKNEKNLVELISIELLIKEKKAAEAMLIYESSIKSNPAGILRSEMEILLAETYLELKDLKTCRSLLKNLADKNLTDSELKSRKLFIDASLLQADGKDEEAAILFLRVGQTATNSQTALKSLFMAGKAFYTAKQCNRAIIAFKILLEKKRNKFTDETLYYLSLSHAQCKDFQKALSTVDQLILTGRNPELKKRGLFEKGDYWLMAGDKSKAIEAYNDFTVVYTNDSRNAAIWYKIYKIHLKQNELTDSANILDKIIKNSSSNSPEVYSSALHQRALLHQFKGENRESISLWQKYLEFNLKVETKDKDEVKLMLAAAFQNSESQNLSAAAAIYDEILLKSSNDKIKELALLNLLETVNSEPNSRTAALKKLLSSKQEYPENIINLLCAQALKVKELTKESESFISSLKNAELRNFWAAGLLYERGNKEDAARAIELLKTVKDEKFYVKKLALLRDLHFTSGDKEAALNTSLEIIYCLTSKENWNESADLNEMEQSSLMAIELLSAAGKKVQAAKIYKRISDLKFPLQKATVEKIENILQVKK